MTLKHYLLFQTLLPVGIVLKLGGEAPSSVFAGYCRMQSMYHELEAGYFLGMCLAPSNTCGSWYSP